ncbi:unnamed protein product [Symbiodinium sp. CCMP2592]|nr:unnamed protein product [Symbiodinium sp. CCMP2592]
MMGMWGPQSGPNPGGLGGNLGVAPMMGAASALPGMIPCAGCGAVPAVPVPGARMSLPAINEGQRHYMGQIVMGMKTSNLFQVAQNLEAAVNSQVPIPQEFLATVHLWMKSRAQSESGLSQMQLAQFIGASSFNNQVQANVQMLAQTPPAPASPPPPPASPPASPPLAASPPLSAPPASAPPLPASPMFIPSPPLPTSPMYVESPMGGDGRDLRRPAEPSQGPKARDRRPAEPTKPPGREVRDSRRPAEPDLPPRRRHPLPPPPSTSFGSAGSSSYLGGNLAETRDGLVKAAYLDASITPWRWRYLQWDPTTRAQLVNNMRGHITDLTVKESLATLAEGLEQTDSLTRFHPLRKLTESMAGESIGFALQFPFQGELARNMYCAVLQLCNCAATQLFAAQIRIDRCHRSSLANTIAKHGASC